MPPGTPNSSFLYQYPIRVDEFATIQNMQAKLHLLTHAHSDHIVGLQNKSFDQRIICSHDTKEIMLRYEAYRDRYYFDHKFQAEKKRLFGHLQVQPVIAESSHIFYQGSKDLLKVLPLNTPYHYDIDGGLSVTITLIDANHCPGSVMFLVEGKHGNILHTGDIRAEPWYLESLKHNPYLRPYLAMPGAPPGVLKTLDAIYLDTACVFNKEDVPTKEDATSGLIALMRLIPRTTHFYLNTWTWGYEDILTAVACAFGSKIHIDRYKYNIHTNLEQEPLLRSIGTQDASRTRFHACERFHRCEYCNIPEDRLHNLSPKGNRVVYVNPVSTMNKEVWKAYQTNTKNRIVAGENVTSLLIPLARHSPLPELQEFVSLFKPKTIIPNTLDPALDNLDWVAIHRAFQPHLSGRSNLVPSTQNSDMQALQDLSQDEDGVDVSLKNLIGDDMDDVASKWVDGRGKRRKLELIKEFLGITEPFPVHPLTRTYKDVDIDGYDSSSDVNDEGGRTMHKLFAPQVGIEVIESQGESSSPTRERQLLSPRSSPASKRPLPDSPTPPERPEKRFRLQCTPSPLPRSSTIAVLTPRPVRSYTTPTFKGKGKAMDVPLSTPTPIRASPAAKNKSLIPSTTKPSSCVKDTSSLKLQSQTSNPIHRAAMAVSTPKLTGRARVLSVSKPIRRGAAVSTSNATNPPSRAFSIRSNPAPLKTSASAPSLSRPRKDISQESLDHDSDDDDERGITADFIFGGIGHIFMDSEDKDEVLADVANILDDMDCERPVLPKKTGTIVIHVTPEPTTPVKKPPRPEPLSMRVRKLEEKLEFNRLRIEANQKHSPDVNAHKIKELQMREQVYMRKLEIERAKLQRFDDVCSKLVGMDVALDWERVARMKKDIDEARKQGKRVADVIPLLHCTSGVMMKIMG